MTVHEALRWRLLKRAGLLPPAPPIEEIWESEWDPWFERLMHHRLVLGFFRYGGQRDASKPPYRNGSSAIERLEKYLVDGNREHLVDAANLCLVEWVRGALGMGEHPDPTWKPIDDGTHTREL